MENLPIGNQSDPTIWEILSDQVNVLLVILDRMAVQRQLIAIVVILLVAWLIPEALRHWRRRKNRAIVPQSLRQQTWWQRTSAILYPLFAPIVSLLLIYVTSFLFESNGFPNGLLQNVQSLFIIWLVFRLVIAILYARFGDAFRPFHRWIFTPLLVIVILASIISRLPAAGTIFEIPLFNSGDVVVTFNGLIFAALTLYAFFVVGWILEQVMIETFPKRFAVELGEIKSISTLIRYFVIGIGIVIALGVMGFSATSLAIVAGSLLVGVGIGLQDIVANFVSGLTLLFEQSMRSGDIIEIDGRVNQVKKISLRATIVNTMDNTELIIPNATFTTAQVANLSRDNGLVRIRLPFGVAYGSDLEKVGHAAIEAALENELTLPSPSPAVLHRGFGDSSINFELAVWMNQPRLRERYRSELYYGMQREFKENGIEIPFPQRDLHLRSGINLNPPAKEAD